MMTLPGNGAQPDPVPGNAQDPCGIVVLSSARKILYLNKAARDLLTVLNQHERGRASNDSLPRSIEYLLDEILALVRIQVDHRGWRRLAAKRLLKAPGESVLVQAFGMRRRPDAPQSPIVLTMR
ncbi:MAG TPA: hypothetical protein VJL88_09040 [Nitrospira sp.]|nr:hypothetical protein [Nitrospira sp.]